MNKYQELLQVLEKEHQITCKAANIEETDRAKAYFQLLWTSIGLGDKKMTTWKMYSESKPLFSDLYLVKFKDGCFLGEYGVCYYSQEHKSFGEFISFYDSERDEDDEAFVSCESIVAWAPFQRIDEEHKEKTAEQMFNDLGYTKRVFDDFIVYKKGNYIRLKVIEFHLRTEIVHSYIESAAGNTIKNLDVDELKAINKQCEELNWL